MSSLLIFFESFIQFVALFWAQLIFIDFKIHVLVFHPFLFFGITSLMSFVVTFQFIQFLLIGNPIFSRACQFGWTDLQVSLIDRLQLSVLILSEYNPLQAGVAFLSPLKTPGCTGLSKLINFYSPWNHQKTYGFLMISGGEFD